MRTFVVILSVYHIVSIEAINSEADLIHYDSIENTNRDGGQSNVAVIVKSQDDINKETDQPGDVQVVNASPYVPERDHNDEISFINEEKLKVVPLNVLRKKPWKDCLKRGSKICYKACKSAKKAACSYQTCHKKLKKTLKKECKRNCKSFFLED